MKYGSITNTLTKEILSTLYYGHNKSLQDIADEYNCTRSMIKHLMDTHGLARRRQGEARVLAIKEGKFDKFVYHEINENFFSEWSPAMAWVLGVLFTDGCIQHVNNHTAFRVSIDSIDFELLQKIRWHLGTTHPISKKPQSYDSSKFIYHFAFYREKMGADLLNLGLIERKSLIMQFPNVPDEYKRHFIRGCWDGDGSVYICSNGQFNASYVSGSKDFIQSLVKELFKIGIYRKSLIKRIDRTRGLKIRIRTKEEIDAIKRGEKPLIMNEIPKKPRFMIKTIKRLPLSIHKKKRAKVYSIKLNSRENLEMIFNYFYGDVDESICLFRKYKVFVVGLESQ